MNAYQEELVAIRKRIETLKYEAASPHDYDEVMRMADRVERLQIAETSRGSFSLFR